MAIAELISKANDLSDHKKYEEAISLYDQALSKQPSAFNAHLQKSIALHRLKKFDEALGSLYNAEVAAKSRNKRDLFALLIFRYSLVLNAKGDPQNAIKFLNLSDEYGYEKKEIGLWKFQIEKKAKKLQLSDFDSNSKFDSLDTAFEFTKEFKRFAPALPTLSNLKIEEIKDDEAVKPKPVKYESKAESIEKEKKELEQKMLNKDNLYPIPKDIKKDWFQSTTEITVSLFIKNLPKDDTLKVKLAKSLISIEFPTSKSSEFQYEIGPLFGNIIPKESSFKVFQTKLEFCLRKEIDIKWKNLERSEDQLPISSNNNQQESKLSSSLNYPNSKGKDWSKFNVEDDDNESEDENKGDENAFFQQLYQGADDDTRRAMMKSFVESNGTSLSTNWDEVSKKTFETSPPDGLEVRKWK